MSNANKWNTTANIMLALAPSKQDAYALSTKPDGATEWHLACWEAAVKANDAETAKAAHEAADGNRGAIFTLAMAAKRLGVPAPK
jgi:hypothetical protein